MTLPVQSDPAAKNDSLQDRQENLASDLPSLSDAGPESDVVIFDGKCVFCTGQVRRLARWDRTGRLVYVSLHDPRVVERYPDLTHDQMMEQMFVITADGRRFGGADAVRYLSRRLPWLWFIAPLIHIPFSMPLWRWMYGAIARRRYKLAGKVQDCDGGTCDLHLKK